MNQLSAPDLAAWLNDTTRAKPLLLDVREPWEIATASLTDITAIPMQQIPQRIEELQQLSEGSDAGIVAICHHGARSMQVAMFLERQGLGPIHNLAGGMEAWSTQVDPIVPRY